MDDHPYTPVTPQTESRKRKQQTTDATEEPVTPRAPKKAKLDTTTKPRSAKKEKMGSDVKGTSFSTKSDSEPGKRVLRGRPEQNHDGKKCCNTCQAWKDLSQFGLKKHSKTPGESVGYCLRCQASKQAKNKAKAKAKKETARKGTEATSNEIDRDIEDASGGEDLGDDKSLEEIVVGAEE
jgi:hypothetical protein